jgi:hypothetical protein
MNKNKNKLKSLGVSISLGLMLSVSSYAIAAEGSSTSTGTGTSSGQTQTNTSTPQLMIPEYTTEQLKKAQCEPQVWTNLVQTYLSKRGVERQVQGQIQVIDQAKAAPAANQSSTGGAGGSCWDTAMGQLGSISSTFDDILSIFTGGFDFQKAADLVTQQVTNYACNQLLNYTGKIAYGANSAMNGVYNSTIGNIGINQGPININGGQVLNNPRGTNSGGPATDLFNQGKDALGNAASTFK